MQKSKIGLGVGLAAVLGMSVAGCGGGTDAETAVSEFE